jgi:hypothetical protein
MKRREKMKLTRILAATSAIVALASSMAFATPSTQIWIPSTDIQAYKTAHLNIDNYFRSGTNLSGGRDVNVLDIGPTFGILPFEKVQMEVGFDYLVIASNPNDNHPFSGNFKLGTPEDSLFKNSPALAAGMYNIGSVQSKTTAPVVISGQNIIYALAAKTLPAIGAVPSLGRISAGYYNGNERALATSNGGKDNDGILLSWDRSMSEISDKLWLAVDYQSGRNAAGALNFGGSWNFAKNVSVIFGYNVYNDHTMGGRNSFTTQLDINFP